MKEKFSLEEFKKEYRCFLGSKKVAPPSDLTALLKKTFRHDLNPSGWSVFCKLFAIHFIAGVVTLYFCPQFGISIHAKNGALLNFFRSFGEYGCMIACGALFLGGTGLVAGLLLRSQEIRVIRRTRTLQLGALAFLSLGLFLSVREAEEALPLSLSATWLIGALTGGFFTFQLGWFVRGKVQQYLVP